MRDWLLTRARRSPDSIALIDADRGESWTYRELNVWVSRRADRLAASGVGLGDRVGILCRRSPDVVSAFWGVFRAGGVAVMLDVTESTAVLDTAMETADITHLLVAPEMLETGQKAASSSTRILSLGSSERQSTAALDGVAAEPSPPVDRSIDRTVLIMFTSGTTGDPKGVRLTPRNLGASAAGSAFRLGVEGGDRWLLTLPTYHMGGLSILIRTAIYGTMTVLEREFDARSTAETMAEYDVTGVSLVPTMLRRLLREGWRPGTLRFALVGGAPTPPDLATEALEAGIPIYPTYGMTETASQITTATPADAQEDPETVGRPIRSANVTIEGETATVSEHEDAGPIVVSGPIVSPGYLDGDQPTGEPTENGDGSNTGSSIKTGDVGYMDEDGRLFVVGRVSSMIITGGENVVPAVVEEAIEDHPAVEAACVVGIPDPEWGEQVAALVVSTGSVFESELRTYLADRVAPYKVAKTIVFDDALPRTHSGTIDRSAVRSRILERLTDEDP